MIDPRTNVQCQHDVFVGLMTAGLRSTGAEPGGMRSTATIVAVVQLAGLENSAIDRGIAWLDDIDEPVFAASVRDLASDADIVHMLLGTFGEILALGSTQRLFTTAQRRALAARGDGCVWPRCTAPPSWCRAHHVEESGDGGATHTDNEVLLCAAHHHMLHSSHFTMKMVNAKPQLLASPWLHPEQLWRSPGRARVRMGRAGEGAARRRPAWDAGSDSSRRDSSRRLESSSWSGAYGGRAVGTAPVYCRAERPAAARTAPSTIRPWPST
jgi:hypothetical protein